MEQNKITKSLEKLVHKLYSAKQIYDDVISYYDDEAKYVVIKYILSDRTKITYSKESKHYDASIILDIEEIVKDDEVYYYQHDIPEYVWDDLIDYEYNKIDKILSPVVSNILIDVNITFIDKKFIVP
jgi:hypothetical protein